jgi:hypothetical protein
MNLDAKTRKALEALLKHDVILMSWGISDIKIDSLNITFLVQGLKYQGLVSITPIYSSSFYKVVLSNINEQLTDVENLVSLLDGLIEKTDNYETDLVNLIFP